MIGLRVTGSKTLRETRVLLLRHAETSEPDRFHGAESDVGLGAAGRRQAEDVARVLATVPVRAIYSSAMRRARETAEPIGRACGLTPETVAPLHERRIGPMSGLLREEAWDAYAQAKARWMAGELEYTHEGGESFSQIRERVVPPFRTLATRHEGDTIAVVAHGVVIRVLITSLVEGYGPHDFARIGIEFVAPNDLRWDGTRWRMEPWAQPVRPDGNGATRIGQGERDS
jgi:broad specificity phosphatase PhoE